MSSRLQAMEVYCPECGAAIYEACLLAREGRTGRIYRRACHRARHTLYQRNRGPRQMAKIRRDNVDLIRYDESVAHEAGAGG